MCIEIKHHKYFRILISRVNAIGKKNLFIFYRYVTTKQSHIYAVMKPARLEYGTQKYGTRWLKEWIFSTFLEVISNYVMRLVAKYVVP